MENKISVVINTYNAELHLARVLEAVKDFDEILICDMESTDSTLEIAKKYGCKVVTFERKKYNIVEPAREYAIHEAKYPWVLVVDADEIVTPALREYLYQRISPQSSIVRQRLTDVWSALPKVERSWPSNIWPTTRSVTFCVSTILIQPMRCLVVARRVGALVLCYSDHCSASSSPIL